MLAGLAGLSAGAFSMAVGEYTSVASQAEAARLEIDKERREIDANEEGEIIELAAMYAAKGVDRDLALQVARQIHRDRERAVAVHAREELGVDEDECGRHAAILTQPPPEQAQCAVSARNEPKRVVVTNPSSPVRAVLSGVASAG